MNLHEKYMQRCLQLAQIGLGNVAPNPMVGCVIVHNDKIIGEGYHQQFGQPHAEVNAINSVKDQLLLTQSTLYVNLEPCAHHGKTPPCTDLIIVKKIPRVVIGCTDAFEQVNGKGIEKLKAAGIDVFINVLQNESIAINRRFFTYHKKRRPFIILKWAQSADGFIASKNHKQNDENKIRWISSKLSRKLVHKWRSEEQAIMVGTNTALADNPQLDVRDWKGLNPLRIVIDRNLRLPAHLNMLNKEIPTIVFSVKEKTSDINLQFIQINFENLLDEILSRLYLFKIQSVVVEGGSKLLTSFIENNLWDEARVFTSVQHLGDGVIAPKIAGIAGEKIKIGSDNLSIIYNK